MSFTLDVGCGVPRSVTGQYSLLHLLPSAFPRLPRIRDVSSSCYPVQAVVASVQHQVVDLHEISRVVDTIHDD